MSRRRHMLSFTERRRASLAKKVVQLERLETRNTITEPISVLGLSLSALRELVRLGIVGVNGLSNERNGPMGLNQAINQTHPPAPVRGTATNVLPVAIGSPAAGGGAAATSEAVERLTKNPAPAGDSLSVTSSSPQDSAAPGISLPWKPASGPGGGAALPPRGGSGGSRAAGTSASGHG